MNICTTSTTCKRRLAAPIYSDDEDEEIVNNIPNGNDSLSEHKEGPVAKKLKLGTCSIEIAHESSENISISEESPNAVPAGDSKRYRLWSGILEWFERADTIDQFKITKNMMCEILGTEKSNQERLTAKKWPSKLTMQLFPKRLLSVVGPAYIKNARYVLCQSSETEKFKSLINLITEKTLAGYVHFGHNIDEQSDVNVLILVYSQAKKSFIGFIPHEQKVFMKKLFNEVSKRKKQEVPGTQKESSLKEISQQNGASEEELILSNNKENNQISNRLSFSDIQEEQSQIVQNIKQLTGILEETRKMTDAYKIQLESICEMTSVQVKEAINVLQQTDSKLEALKNVQN